MDYNETQQQAIVKAFELLITHAVCVQELIQEPILGKILCYSPTELSKERKNHLERIYNAKMDELRKLPYKTKLERAFFKANAF